MPTDSQSGDCSQHYDLPVGGCVVDMHLPTIPMSKSRLSNQTKQKSSMNTLERYSELTSYSNSLELLCSVHIYIEMCKGSINLIC